MKARLIVALAALGGLTAFAPAPFPKTERRGERDLVTLQSLQGDWRVVSFDEIGQNGQLSNVMWFQGVRVAGSRLRYLVGNQEQTPFRIVVDGKQRPAAIDFHNDPPPRPGPDRPYMVGIVGRDGARVKIMYYWTTPENRARSFESMPPKWWILVLERG